MTTKHAESPRAATAAELVETLQERFRLALETLCSDLGGNDKLTAHRWLRDEGRHGGGLRYATAESATFNRAAINVSGVHYDDEPSKKLSSATALSTIIHPRHPRAPSVHLHISWTELRDGSGYWRIMADLNPSIEDPQATSAFEAAVRAAAPSHWAVASEEGAKYFFIPALGRTRGVSHFYLEGFATSEPKADAALARRVGGAVIDSYVQILRLALSSAAEPTAAEQRALLEYHTLYLFQVLTLDRGTTSGLLVHDQNDLGIMGSLPTFVDRALLASWAHRLAAPQDALLWAIVEALPNQLPCPVTNEVRRELAKVVRGHYRQHPHALDLQAAGSTLPPTVANHL